MLFNSYIFIFAFLPIVLVAWYGLNHFHQYKLAQIFVILMSLWFYGYFNYSYLAIILSSIIVNWSVSKAIEYFEKKRPDNGWGRKILGISGVAFNMGLLFYFKYYDFFISNCNAVFRTNWPLKYIVLPLGISFFTFQQVSFVIDRMKGTAPHYNPIDYAMYVVYFPQLIAGPIVSHNDLIPQFWETEKRQFNWDSMLRGIRLFVIGLAKKVLLADKLGKIVDSAFGNIGALDSVSAFVAMLAYTFQIFFDFSGYCDMALGLGAMMNFDLPLNFNSPYKSHSVKEFWNRWHITLSAFFTKYVYIPLGGSRKGTVRLLCNTMIVFLLSGIWHGANWTFILWGILHGIMVCCDNLIKPAEERLAQNQPKCYAWVQRLRWLVTFGFVNLAWVLFRCNSIGEAILFYKRLVSFTNTGYVWNIKELFFLVLAAFLCTRPAARDWVEQKNPSVVEMVVLAVLFGCSVLTLSGVATFLYFNF